MNYADTVRLYKLCESDDTTPKQLTDFLKTADVDINEKDGAVIRLLLGKESIDLLRVVLEHGADPNRYGNFPPHIVLAYNSNGLSGLPVIELLLQYGADINGGYVSLLERGIETQCLSLIKFALENGADLSKDDYLAFRLLFKSHCIFNELYKHISDEERDHLAAVLSETSENFNNVEKELFNA